MATTFKVPSSPAKSIFEIDEFLGVDMTNSGTNVEERRSPNAPNMVRFVPGKVRKRTGYHTDTVFGNGLNTNLAIGADDKVDEFELDTYDSENYTNMYDLFIPLGVTEEDKPLYLEFDYKSEYRFWVTGAGWLDASPDEFTHFEAQTSVEKQYTLKNLRARNSKDNPVQTIQIKRLSATYKKDENYRWQKAPRVFQYRDKNEPIYGCHTIKSNSITGNRVVNVNRILGTSDSFVSVPTTTSFAPFVNYAEPLSKGRIVYVDFDYELTGDDCVVEFTKGNDHTLKETVGEEHFSFTEEAKEKFDFTSAWVKSLGSSTLQIKNLTLVYEKNEYYSWSQAPEDNEIEFPYEDVYLVGSTNYSTVEFISTDNAQEVTTTSDYTVLGNFTFCEPEINKGKVSFDLYITTSKTLSIDKLKINVLMTKSGSIYTGQTTIVRDFDGKINHYEIYNVADEDYKITGITVKALFKNTGNGRVFFDIKNIKVNPISVTNVYDKANTYSLFHVGNDLYINAEKTNSLLKVYDNANKHVSSSWQLGEALYILDGKEIYSYTIGDETVKPISEGEGYIPTVTIGKKPSGGGISYEPLNMLQPAFYETFYVGSDDPEDVGTFNLSFSDLDSTEVKVWTLTINGTWKEWKENVDFTVNRFTGAVYFTFDTPGRSPLTGEDNVKILAYRTVPGYKERITNCTIGTLFGVNGATDRLFLSGNAEYPNWDFYSEQYNPTYFPDEGYSALGLSTSAIVGYAIVNNYLATFKDEYEPSQSVFIREGDTMTDENTKILRPVFKLINTLQGNGVIAPKSFGYVQTEPLFLTRSGIYAITAQDITGEKYSQNRSFYLNGALTKEPNLESAYAIVYNDMYVLALNNKLYILDGLQPTRTDKSEPYATRQYVGFYCTDVPANCMWTNGQALWFGTTNGQICEFATDIDDLESYNDNGLPIYCCWETPDLDGKLFYKNKSFRYIAIRMMSALKTSAKLWSMARGAWSFIKEDTTSGIFFDFENIDFESFSFSTDRSDKVAHSKIRVKKVDKARFKIENSNLNEPFGLMNLALEYVESGNYKG